jgi:translation initiation factor IF-3
VLETNHTLRLPRINKETEAPANPINRAIRAPRVRIIGSNNTVMDTHVAIAMAEDQLLDLIQISVSPEGMPVCKIEDFGKFQFQKQKIEHQKQRDQREAAKKNDVKELQLRVEIDPHDLGIKLNQAKEFIKDQRRVKWVLKFKGREMTHLDRGTDLIDLIHTSLSEVATPGNLQKEGKVWHQIWQPKKA